MPFKAAVEKLALQHMKENLDTYIRGEINASARRILFTKWVGQSWEEVSTDRDLVFKKCGISVAVDGTEDGQIHIEGLDNYSAEDNEGEFTDEDPFSDCEL